MPRVAGNRSTDSPPVRSIWKHRTTALVAEGWCQPLIAGFLGGLGNFTALFVSRYFTESR